jgi:hypothetical protein
MRRPLSRNRRIAVLTAACGSVVASSSTLLTVTAAHSGISDFARGIGTGLTLGTAIALLAVSLTFLKRDRAACSRGND